MIEGAVVHNQPVFCLTDAVCPDGHKCNTVSSRCEPTGKSFAKNHSDLLCRLPMPRSPTTRQGVRLSQAEEALQTP
uniref:Kazal-like domain-containing protein n=1 Tax=Steinernema glaseri TaxID=37863 RepID=A0A1I7YPL6_9BILA